MVSQQKRKVSPSTTARKHRKRHKCGPQAWVETKTIPDGNTSTIKHLLTRLNGTTASGEKSLWASPAEAITLPEDQLYFDLSIIKFIGLPSMLSDRPRPPFIREEHWSHELCAALSNAIMRYHAAESFESAELGAMLSMIFGDQKPRIEFEESFAGVFGHQKKPSFYPSLIQKIGSADFFIFGGSRPAENTTTPATWYLMVVDIRERTLYFIDPAFSSHNISEQQRRTLFCMRRLWEESIYPMTPNVLPPQKAVNLPFVQHNHQGDSGLACIMNAYLLMRHPSETLNLMQNKKASFQVSQERTKALIESFERCLQLNVHTEWRKPPNKQNKRNPVAPFLYGRLDESMLELALSVQRGSWNHLKKLLWSIYGDVPRATDNYIIPSQVAPPRIIPADTLPYKPWTARASALMAGRVPPDRSEPILWNNMIGPRIANVLLRMAQCGGAEGSEISAYLHMVLIDFFVDGQRAPKVMIENCFGEFLKKGAPRTDEWDRLVMENKPRFLIIGRGQKIVGDHWYVIIVDLYVKIAYCFDSTKTDNRADRVDAFFDLREAWSSRLSGIPVPEKMVEVPSLIHSDHHSSGFLCMYHIALLFREPARLRRLKRGVMTAAEEDFDCIIRLAEGYIGIKVEGSFGTSTPVSESESDMDSRNDLDRLDLTDDDVRLKSYLPHNKLETGKNEPGKNTYNERKLAGASLLELNVARCPHDPGPGPGLVDVSPTAPTPGRPRQLPVPALAQEQGKTYQRSSATKDILDSTCDRVPPVGSAARIAQFAKGFIQTPYRWFGENWRASARRPLPI